MNKGKLTWLGCSTLALMLLATDAASASTVRPQDAGSVGNQITDSQAINQPSGQETSTLPSLATNDKVKQLALATFGCGCANCQSQVRQMLQQGTLTLPQ